jgi:hypothetical protein
MSDLDRVCGKVMLLLAELSPDERALVTFKVKSRPRNVTTETSEKRASAGRAGAIKRWQNDGKTDSKTMANFAMTDGKTVAIFATHLPSEGGRGEISISSDSQISDLGSPSPISSASLSNPGTSPGARGSSEEPGAFTRGSLPISRESAEEDGRHPPRDTVAGAVPREAGILVHGALPPNADYMVSVYEAAVARAMGLPRWSMGTRRRDNAEAVARILDDWAWDDDGTPLPRASPMREEWLRMNVEHYCAHVVKPARATDQAKFVTPSPNCFVRWLNDTASARGGAQNDPDYEREEKQDRASETRAAPSRRPLDSPESASTMFTALAAKGAANGR